MQVFFFTEEALCSALATLTYLNSGSSFCYWDLIEILTAPLFLDVWELSAQDGKHIGLLFPTLPIPNAYILLKLFT